MAKAKTGSSMSPTDLLSSAPSFTGGTAGPSNVGGVTQNVNNTLGSAFSVGKGATAGATATDALSRVLPFAMLLIGAVVVLKVFKK